MTQAPGFRTESDGQGMWRARYTGALTALLAILGLVPSTLSAGDDLTRSIGPWGS